MSIVPLVRVSLIGMSCDKASLLDDLYRFGCLEIIPPSANSTSSPDLEATERPREALRFLLASPQRRRQALDASRFDAIEVESQALELQQRLSDLEAERDDVFRRLQLALPFGDFDFAAPETMADWRLWFYAVPRSERKKLPETSGVDEQGNRFAWEQVQSDNSNVYLVVVSESEPTFMPTPRIEIGSVGSKALKRRLEEVELAIEDAQAERAYLTRWCVLLSQSLTELHDVAIREMALRHTSDNGELFALEAWVPQEHYEELGQYAQQHGYACQYRLPTIEDAPPTFMRNEKRMEAGEDLVNFYMTPGYWTWDPSSIVLVSFAIFFAMILSDAGYAAVLGLALAISWAWLGQPAPSLADGSAREDRDDDVSPTVGQRFRPMLLLIVVVSLVYGVLVGSYFGNTPPSDSLLGRLHLLDMNNSRLMMGISVLIGGLHVVLANVMDARRHADFRDGLASVGWALAVSSGLLLGAGAAIASLAPLKVVGGIGVVIGLLLVVAFTAWRESPLPRLLQGLLGLTKISAAFGDVLSYLRLFALGLASASLATAFNDMAEGIRASLPRLGLLLALLILLFGHSLNLLLGISSGVIHGLRLNVIEFFNWGLKDEGRRFSPFRRREGSLWK
ncbi:ATPase V [Blastopirellula sp. JC732]|uniref:ATPase V n=1 Tax=Blastopirellula sediminis TaxID=2894196 RepID=A0A9X1ML17_9BACT|nr:V-type ATPase 116kDa subunit family protein [Blastopirellula sediminis]MCC9608282.1 ATPase V [Blastopirellula sediminis]MCC9628953.1 ATPase V [Blastopirellula sediminis]